MVKSSENKWKVVQSVANSKIKPGKNFKASFNNEVLIKYNLIFFFCKNSLKPLTFLSEKSKHEKIMIKVSFWVKNFNNDSVFKLFNLL